MKKMLIQASHPLFLRTHRTYFRFSSLTMNLLLQCTITYIIIFLPCYLYYTKKISGIAFSGVFGLVSLIAFILPLIFRFSLALQRGVLYLYFVGNPDPGSLKHLERFNITRGRNFYLYNGNVSLGVWHLLPFSYENTDKFETQDFENALTQGHPIFVYLHGNIGTRGTDHRLKLYEILTDLDCHVITFDYRCYGDSTYDVPHERALASDGEAVYKWVFKHAKGSPIFVWGHSLGTGLTTNMLASVSRSNQAPKGVILESPFDDMPSEIKVHPFGTVFRILPWYNYLFSRPYYTNDEGFNSSKYILEYSSPTLILHSEDDGIIPSFLGEKLYKIGLKNRKNTDGPMEIKVFKSHRELGHTLICNAPELPEMIKTFVSKYKDRNFN